MLVNYKLKKNYFYLILEIFKWIFILKRSDHDIENRTTDSQKLA
jgi:hypothetical protein